MPSRKGFEVLMDVYNFRSGNIISGNFENKETLIELKTKYSDLRSDISTIQNPGERDTLNVIALALYALSLKDASETDTSFVAELNLIEKQIKSLQGDSLKKYTDYVTVLPKWNSDAEYLKKLVENEKI